MINIKVNDIFEVFNLEKTQLNIASLKALFVAMKRFQLLDMEKQNIIFEENVFIYLWSVFLEFLYYFDLNYNRKTDLSLFFSRLIESLYQNKTLNFYALFCPGYTISGYKDYLGDTTIWKLKKLKELTNMMSSYQISVNMLCLYADVFLENCDSQKNMFWHEQMEYNRSLFHIEGEKYFEAEQVRNMSSLEPFNHDFDLKGYVDEKKINSISQKVYNSFLHCNEKFYKKMNFTKEQIRYRNDRLLTMYKIFSDYINEQPYSIYLPMENMYERENVFSTNNTCTMYLKLKKRCKNEE